MKCVINGKDFCKLLQYKDSICISVENGILKACAKLKGLETLVAFNVDVTEGTDDFFAVTFSDTVNYFKDCDTEITVTASETIVTISDGIVSIDVPITRDVIADYTIPEHKEEDTRPLRKTGALRSMLSTMSEVSKALLDYSGTYLTVYKGIASILNCSMLLECEVDLPDLRVSASAMLNALSIVNVADDVLVVDDERYILFITDSIVIRIVKEQFAVPITSESLMAKHAVLDTTDVKAPGVSKTLRSLSYFKDSSAASITYNENELGVSMRGNTYNVHTDVVGHTVFLNPRVLVVLGRFLNADHYNIVRGEKHVCLSTMSRKLVICATSF